MKDIVVSFITVNFNGLNDTKELIESIQLHTQDIPYEIIVVDNASNINPEGYFRSENLPVKFIRSEKNLGFAGGNNLGIKAAKGKFLFFVNNDTIVTQHLASGMVQRFNDNKNLGMLSPKILFFNTDTIQYAGFRPLDIFARNSAIGNKEPNSERYQDYTETYSCHGASMMIPQKVISEVGMMHEDFFLYYEELDWACQIRNHGYEVFVDQSLTIYHKESMSVGKSSTTKIYYQFRNRILFVRRNFRWVKKLFALSYLILVVFTKNYLTAVLKRNPENARLYIKAVLWNLSINQ